MPKDTQDARKYLCNEMVLTILRLADEDMLSESGNPVYLKMKRELDEIRAGSTTSENKPDTRINKEYIHPLMVPILGIRYTSDGKRLVFRANPPPGERRRDPDDRPADADRTLVDVSPDSDMIPTSSK